MIIDIYPFKNKSKINLVFERRIYGEVLYDTSNYKEWMNERHKKIASTNDRRYDWRATNEYFKKREIHWFFGNKENNGVSLIIYSDSDAALTKRKKKMINPFLVSIEIFMYVVLAQQYS